MACRQARGNATARLSLRVDLDDECRIGPGKVRLLEEIAAQGSISAAGRALGMSYKRAWDLVDELNRIFKAPLVETRIGGHGRGGAQLTDLGRSIVGHYRAIELKAASASALHLDALAAVRSKVEPAMPPETGSQPAKTSR